MQEKYVRFEYKEYQSDIPKIFFLNQETGDIYEFFMDYSKSSPKFNARKVVNLEAK